MGFKQQFDALKKKRVFSSDEELLAFFDVLPAVRIEETLSMWSGGDFDTGHWGTKALQEMKWFGKWYRSKLDALPLVCFNEKGELFSNKFMKGEASLWEIGFRGKVSTAMVYDGVPIFDHLRKVDENTLFGIMDGKSFDGFPDIVQNGRYYFFYLERVQEFPSPFVAE